MSQFNVHLFMGATSAEAPPEEVPRRLQVLQSLRDELLAEGGCALSGRRDADVHVEIVTVLGGDDGPIVRAAKRARRVPERTRILIVRLSAEDDSLEFVCSDGVGDVLAETRVARRIHAWCSERGAPGSPDGYSGAIR